MKRCFIVSPIGESGSVIRDRADKLLKHIIQPVCEKHDFEVIRADKIRGIDRITDSILIELANADLVIADATGNNPNVFYEMGFRKALGKPIIHMIASSHMLPFDVANTRTIFYDFDVESVPKIQNQLAETINAISFEPKLQNEDSLEKQTLKALSNIMEEIAAIKDNMATFLSISADDIEKIFDDVMKN